MSDPPIANAGIEDWNDGDFDLNSAEICIQRANLQPTSFPPTASQTHADQAFSDELGHDQDWDRDFLDHAPLNMLHDYQDGLSANHNDGDGNADQDQYDQEQTDTIKLSDFAGSQLKQMIQAHKAGQLITDLDQLHHLESLSHPDEQHDLSADAPKRARGFASDFDEDEHHQALSGSASASTTTSTSYKSLLGLSTDFTDPDSPPRSKSASRSSAAPSINARLAQNADPAHSSTAAPSDDPEFEGDFDLAPNVQKLSLSLAISRQRSHPTLEQQKLLWGDDPIARSASPDLASSATRSRTGTSTSADGTSATCLTSESDADDEQEDMLDGLVLAGSVFEMDAAQKSHAPNQIKVKLEKLLDLKRAGDAQQDAAGAHKAETEADLAAGLVITDDLDLSPSRLSSRRISFRSRTRGPSQLSHPSSRQSSLPHYNSPRDGLPVHDDSFRRPDSFLRRESSSSSSSTQKSRPPISFRRDSSRPGLPSSSSALEPSSEPGPSRLAEPHTHGHTKVPHGGPTLRYKRSASDLQPFKTTEPSRPNPHSRTRGLTRKRSLPSLADSYRNQPRSFTANARVEPKSGISSRLTASTAASRARAAETAADNLARIARDMAAPARPSTPVNLSPSARAPATSATRITVRTRPPKAEGSMPTAWRPQSPKPGTARALTASPPSSLAPQASHFLRRSVPYGDGMELDSIEDIGSKLSGMPHHSGPTTRTRAANDNPSSSASSSAKRGNRSRPSKKRAKPGLIKPLGNSPAVQKVVKGMRWNPTALRWEGNETALRDFDRVVQTSTRPALISQLTGGSISSTLATINSVGPAGLQNSTASLTGSIACGPKVVGDMLFDPVQMKWINRCQDEEVDIFAHLDDDRLSESESDGRPSASHDSDAEEKRGITDQDSTVRSRKADSRWSQTVGPAGSPRSYAAALRQRPRPKPSGPAEMIARAIASGTTPRLDHVDESLWRACIEAESRHHTEVRGFFPQGAQTQTYNSSIAWEHGPTMDEIERPRPHLYYLQKVARDLGKGRGGVASP